MDEAATGRNRGRGRRPALRQLITRSVEVAGDRSTDTLGVSASRNQRNERTTPPCPARRGPARRGGWLSRPGVAGSSRLRSSTALFDGLRPTVIHDIISMRITLPWLAGP